MSLMGEIGMFTFSAQVKGHNTPHRLKIGWFETLFQSSRFPALLNMALIEPLAVLEPVINLIDNENIRESLIKTAQIYFSGITVSLIPSLIIVLLSVVGLLKLLGLYTLSGVGLEGVVSASVDGKTSTSYGKVYSRNLPNNCLSSETSCTTTGITNI